MRKAISKLMLITCSALLVLTSCLGDDETNYINDNEFVYIGKLPSGKKYAQTQIGKVSCDQLEKNNQLMEGDCAFIKIKTSTQYEVSDKVYDNADIFETQEGRIFRERDHLIPYINENILDLTELREGYLPITSINFEVAQHNWFRAGSDWGNRLYLYFNYIKNKGENAPTLIVSYNKNAQPDVNQNKTIDLQLKREGEYSNTFNETETVTGRVIINMTNLRELFKNDAVQSSSNPNLKTISLSLRYYETNPAEKEKGILQLRDGGILGFEYWNQ